jgi:hypothetical protein
MAPAPYSDVKDVSSCLQLLTRSPSYAKQNQEVNPRGPRSEDWQRLCRTFLRRFVRERIRHVKVSHFRLPADLSDIDRPLHGPL